MTEQTDAHPTPWRQGRKVPRNVYDANDAPILMAPDNETAGRIVAALNGAAAAEARGAQAVLAAVERSIREDRLLAYPRRIDRLRTAAQTAARAAAAAAGGGAS